MKKKISKIILMCLVVLGMIMMMNTISNAASFGASISKTTVTVGDTFTVTVTANNAAGMYDVSKNNGNVSVVSGELSEFLENSSATITFKAEAAGTAVITAKATDMTDLDDDTQNVAGTKIFTVTIKEKEQEGNNNQGSSGNNSSSNSNSNNSGSTTVTKSSNNKLSNLGIKPNDFSGFKANTTKYSVTVPNSVSEVEVYATAQDSKATVSGTGKMKLDVGSNQAKVVCTAEDGTTKTYVINITRKSLEEEQAEQQPEEQEQEEVKPTETEQTDETTEVTQITIGLSKLEAIGKNEKGEDVAVELTPTFDENQQEYLLTVPLSVVDVEINAEATDGEAQIEVMGNKNLVEGENVITVIVKVGDNTKVYEIKVNKVAVEGSFLSQELIIQLAVIAAIITIVIVAIIVIIVMIAKNSKKDKTSKKSKSSTEISNEILPDDDKTE